MEQSIKPIIQALTQIDLDNPESARLVDLFQPWLIITDLELKDVIHLSAGDLGANLRDIRDSLSGLTDVIDDDQLQEAACRKIKRIDIYGEYIEDATVAERQKVTLNWDGAKWMYVCDPKLRQQESCASYKGAKAAVFEMLGRK